MPYFFFLTFYARPFPDAQVGQTLRASVQSELDAHTAGSVTFDRQRGPHRARNVHARRPWTLLNRGLKEAPGHVDLDQ